MSASELIFGNVSVHEYVFKWLDILQRKIKTPRVHELAIQKENHSPSATPLERMRTCSHFLGKGGTLVAFDSGRFPENVREGFFF